MKTIEKTKEYVDRYTQVGLTCDMCGRLAKYPGRYEDNPWDDKQDEDWTTSAVTIEHRCSKAYAYDGGGIGKELKVDCCPDCFRTKLLPLFKNVQYREFDW